MGRKEKREAGGKKASSRTLAERCPGFQSTGIHHHRLPTRDVELQVHRSTASQWVALSNAHSASHSEGCPRLNMLLRHKT